MLYDDVINDQDYVGLKRITEDRELRKYNRRAVATKIRVNVPVATGTNTGRQFLLI